MRTKKIIEFNSIDLAKYPFSKDSLEYVKELGFTLDDLKTSYGEKILKKTTKKIIDSILNRTLKVNVNLSPDYDLEILSFYLSILLLHLINDRLLNKIFSTRESKVFYNFCINDELEKIFYLSLNTFNWNIRIFKINNIVSKIGVYFVNYINNMPTFSGNWKLINREIIKGYVIASKRDVCRLLSEEVKKKIINSIEKEREMNAPEVVFNAIEEISKIWIPYSEKIKLSYSKFAGSSANLYPPCIRFILEKVKKGENISHVARFALATFLLNIGKSVDEVVQLFSSLPDFNESITRYQVEHLAGLRGSRKKYIPFKCENMKAYGLCHPDKYCEGIKHPLQYLYKVRNKLWKQKNS